MLQKIATQLYDANKIALADSEEEGEEEIEEEEENGEEESEGSVLPEVPN